MIHIHIHIHYILYIILILIYGYILKCLSEIIYSIIKFKKLLKKHNFILIFNKPERNHIYKTMLTLFEYICKDIIYDIDEHSKIIDYMKINKNNKINILLDSNGGDIISSDTLLNFIITSKIKLNIYVLNKAQSAATLLALSAHNLYMDKFATLGPTDPQISVENIMYSLKSIINLCENKDNNYISDKILLTYYDSKKLHDENLIIIQKILENKFKLSLKKEDKNKFITKLTSGDISHHQFLNTSYINKYLNVHQDIPIYLYDINKLYEYIYDML